MLVLYCMIVFVSVGSYINGKYTALRSDIVCWCDMWVMNWYWLIPSTLFLSIWSRGNQHYQHYQHYLMYTDHPDICNEKQITPPSLPYHCNTLLHHFPYHFSPPPSLVVALLYSVLLYILYLFLYSMNSPLPITSPLPSLPLSLLHFTSTLLITLRHTAHHFPITSLLSPFTFPITSPSLLAFTSPVLLVSLLFSSRPLLLLLSSPLFSYHHFFDLTRQDLSWIVEFFVLLLKSDSLVKSMKWMTEKWWGVNQTPTNRTTTTTKLLVS